MRESTGKSSLPSAESKKLTILQSYDQWQHVHPSKGANLLHSDVSAQRCCHERGHLRREHQFLRPQAWRNRRSSPDQWRRWWSPMAVSLSLSLTIKSMLTTQSTRPQLPSHRPLPRRHPIQSLRNPPTAYAHASRCSERPLKRLHRPPLQSR